MRILHVIPQMGAGGAETIVDTLARDLLAHGDRVDLATTDGFRVGPLVEAGASSLTMRLGSRSAGDLLRSGLRLRRRRTTATAPDLVHAHNVKAATAARLAFGSSVPILATVHGLAERDYRPAVRLLRRVADHVVAVSPGVADALRSAGLDGRRVSVIENCVAAPATITREEARRRLGLSAEARVVVCVARLVRQKRHDLLLEAWHGLPSDAVLLLVGEGPTRAEIEPALAAGGLADRVHLLGERSDVPEILSAADLAVLPTDWEGLPVSLLEAMAAGVPILASDVGDLALTLGTAVELVPPGSAAALHQGLARLLASPTRRYALAVRGRVLFGDRFGPTPMLSAYRAQYARLTGAPATASLAPAPLLRVPDLTKSS